MGGFQRILRLDFGLGVGGVLARVGKAEIVRIVDSKTIVVKRKV
jgi:hypothetical protein